MLRQVLTVGLWQDDVRTLRRPLVVLAADAAGKVGLGNVVVFEKNVDTMSNNPDLPQHPGMSPSLFDVSFFMPKSFHTHPDAVRLGAILKRLRIDRGWTLVKTAQRTGMNPTTSA